MKKVLITREIKAAADTALAIQALGFETLLHPLIEIEMVKYELPKDFKPDYLIITSINAAKAVTKALRNVPCLTVGSKSARYLADKGFNIASVHMDASALLSQLQVCDSMKKFLYLSADHIATDIPKVLTSVGHEVFRVIVYKSKITDAFDYSILKDLSYITFYSPRASQAFYSLCKEQKVSHITAVCFSANIANNLKYLKFKDVIIAKTPLEEELLKIFDI